MSERIEDRLKAQARAMGFELVGIARATPADNFDRYREWLDRGYAGHMDYLHRHSEQRRHPESILSDVRSVLMVGLTYAVPPFVVRSLRDRTCSSPADAISNDEDPPVRSRSDRTTLDCDEVGAVARVAKYALAPDYHQVIWDKLNPLGEWLDSQSPGTRSRGVTDTTPLLERDFARRAGLGWIGKNTMLINKQHGSFFLLGALLTTLELEPDAPHDGSHCGTCTACLDACPTNAFTAPGWLDARLCISYLTIELKKSMPESLREKVGDWLFGCDVCQDVCPWNHRPNPNPGLPSRPELAAIDPIELLEMSPAELRQRFKGTALLRANWRGLLRNAAIILGNRGDPAALSALRKALEWDDETVREACEWAIERVDGSRHRGDRPPVLSR